MGDVVLSVCIPTLPVRERYLSRLLRVLADQLASTPGFEVLVDDRGSEVTIGEKLNDMVLSAGGQYVSFIGDDDLVSHDYVASILDTVKRKDYLDVVTFNIAVFDGGKFDRFWEVDMRKEYKLVPHVRQVTKIAQQSVYRRDVVLANPFTKSSGGEDVEWCTRLLKSGALVKHAHIDRYLYTYFFHDQYSLSHGRVARKENLDNNSAFTYPLFPRGNWPPGFRVSGGGGDD